MTSEEKINRGSGVENIIQDYWSNLIKDESKEFIRTEQAKKSFYSILYDAILNKNPINYISILCPSYKKGENEIGFKKEPGQTTYVAFNNLKRIYENTINLGINATMIALFYDIAVENAHKLSPQDWQDFEQNIIQDKIISKVHNIPYNLVSKIFPSLYKDVGRNGVVFTKEELLQKFPINKDVLENVIMESKEFYTTLFGWTIEEAEKRALCMACAYTIESGIIRKHFKNPVVIYSAYSYNRMALYNGKDGSARIGIICPKRPIGNSLSATISIWKTNKK